MSNIAEILGDKIVVYDLDPEHPPIVSQHLPNAILLYTLSSGFISILYKLKQYTDNGYCLLLVATRPADRCTAAIFILLGGQVFFLPHGKNDSIVNIQKFIKNCRKILRYLVYEVMYLCIFLFISKNKLKIVSLEFGFNYPVQKYFKYWFVERKNINYFPDINLICPRSPRIQYVIIDQPLYSDGFVSLRLYEETLRQLITKRTGCVLKLHPRSDLAENFIESNGITTVERIPVGSTIIGFTSSLLSTLELNGFEVVRLPIKAWSRDNEY